MTSINVTVDLTDLKKFAQDMEDFNERMVTGILVRGAEAAGKVAIQELRKAYPPPQRSGRGQRRGASGRFISQQSPIRTERQRRWWWASMHAKAQGTAPAHILPGWTAAYQVVGGRRTLVISGRYQRTGDLERSLDFVTIVSPGQLEAAIEVGPDMRQAPYAPWVIDWPPPQGQQARYHRGHWTPMGQVIERKSNEILRAGYLKITELVQLRILSVRA
jgi:hypothetical protein